MNSPPLEITAGGTYSCDAGIPGRRLRSKLAVNTGLDAVRLRPGRTVGQMRAGLQTSTAIFAD